MSETTTKTTVEEIDVDIDTLLGIPGSENIITPTKSNIFSTKGPDLGFLDPGNEIKLEKKEPEKIVTDPENIETILDNPEPTKKTTFSTKDLVTFTNNLIEKKLIVPFDDEKKLEEYTLEDFEELFDANIREKESKVREEVPAEFFRSLPEELQYAARYVADGGQDLKGLFQILAQAKDVQETDITTEQGQEQVVRNYLLATNFGTAEEIDEEIDAMKDRKELGTKANRFKPKLDKMQEQLIAAKLEQAEVIKKQRESQAAAYTQNVFKVLEPGNLNGLKLDRKTQNLLFTGLVQPGYSSVTGKQTNLLGHLLEKYQFVEPNHSLVAEALWLLADPEGYKQKVKESGKKEAVAATVRQLKTEQSNKNTSSSINEESTQPIKKGIPRPTQNFFKR